MPSLKDIRKRIASVKNTRKITSAMKMVAAAKLRRAQEAAESSRPYAVKMAQVIASLTERVEADSHPLLEQREHRDKSLVIVITSNRGLCGGYNSNLIRTVNRYVRDREDGGLEVHLLPLGRKSRQAYVGKGYKTWRDGEYDDIIGEVNYANAKRVAQDAIEAFVEGEFDEVHIAYNEFISAIQYNQVVQPLLPLTVEQIEAGDDIEPLEGGTEYIFEPNEEELLAQLLPSHIEVQLLSALFEAEAAEHGARMTAMDNATNNASDMIDSLTLQYNRARQAYITKELVEIVSGAEALNG
jgi:F-type H+-transporting ATPase subunit gamma